MSAAIDCPEAPTFLCNDRCCWMSSSLMSSSSRAKASCLRSGIGLSLCFLGERAGSTNFLFPFPTNGAGGVFICSWSGDPITIPLSLGPQASLKLRAFWKFRLRQRGVFFGLLSWGFFFSFPPLKYSFLT